MGESRNFTALDWVTGEINETLNQARQALESYVTNTDDPTQIRFCLTYLHQVHGILQMVEFYGGALLAEELEKLAQALVDGQVANVQDAHEILMRAILQLPIYLDRVKQSRHDDPGSLLPLLNDLRAVRGGALLTETALFSPNMAAARNIKTPRANITDDKFLDAAKKLRQLYQTALLSIIKDRDYDSNLPRLEKVFTNFEKLCQGTRYQPLWQVSLALLEGLTTDTISANVSINNLLREIEKVIKTLSSDGKPALDRFDSEELIKNLLYYIAGSSGNSPRIKAIKEIFKLESALPKTEIDDAGGGFLTGVDPDAMRSVVIALTEEFSKIKEVFDNYVNKKEENNEALKRILPLFKQAADTLAVLGQGALRKTIEKIAEELLALSNQPELVRGDSLMNAAAKLLEVEGSLNSQFNKDAKDKDGAPPSMDVAMLTARETVLFECQNGLEQAKDAIVEYIASQWDNKHVEPLPGVLNEIKGSLEMVNQRRSARVLGACARYIKEKLIDKRHKPDWKEMDTLADAIAGVEYYLETLDEDVIEDEDTVLAVAEESVANLGYAVARKLPSGALEAVEPSEPAPSKKLTKDKLDAMAAEEKAKRDAEYAAQRAREAEEEKRRREIKWDTDATPLFSDDEFNNIATATEGLHLETEVGFDKIDTSQPRQVYNKQTATPPPVPPVKEPAAEKDENVIEFEFVKPAAPAAIEPIAENEIEELTIEAPVPEVNEAEPTIEVAEIVELPEAHKVIETVEAVDAIEEAEEIETVAVEPVPAEPVVVAATQVATEDPGPLILDNFEKDFDEEIAEIFVEEMEEVLAHIAEFYPQWKASQCKDENSLKEFRRGFHTMKGSGRMAKALSVGELAWAVENMLNRVIDGTIKADARVTGLIDRVLEKVPSMMEAFKQHQPDPDPVLSRRYRLIGEALSKNETPLPYEFDTVAPVAAVELVEQLAETAQPPAEIVVEEAAPAEIDWDLWDIFASEAETHLAVADEWIAYAREQSPLPVEPTDPLQRALHTLKGSAYMAELNAIAELATPLEKFVKALRAFQIQVGDSFTDLLTSCVEEIRTGLGQIQQRQPVVLAHRPDLLTRINAMRLELTGESEDDIASELNRTTTRPAVQINAKVDPTKFNEFLAGGMDALMDASDLLANWLDNPADVAGVQRLQSELKAMGEAAELAGLHPVVSLCKLLQQAYDKVISAQGAGLSNLLSTAQDAHESLINFIDELAGGQDIKHRSEIETALRDFIDSNVTNAIVAPVVTGSTPVAAENELQPIEVDVVERPEPVEAEMPTPAVAAQQPAVVELANPADFDQELLGIFLEEAMELLEQLDTTIADWQSDPSDASQADALKRVLHTYKGGARMAGLGVLGTLAHDLETQLETFHGAADQTLFNQIHDYQDRLVKGTDRVQQLMAGESVNFAELAFGAEAVSAGTEPAVVETVEVIEAAEMPVVAEPEIIEVVAEPEVIEVAAVEEIAEVPAAEVVEVEEVIEAPPVAEAEEIIDAGEIAPATTAPQEEILEYSSDIDADLLGIFIEEATELLEELERGITEWQENPAERSFVDSLKRTLHTLKGGARMSGMMGLGSLAHDLETYLETFTGTGDEALFSMLRDYQERIIKGVDQARRIAAGEDLRAAPVAAVAEPAPAPVITTVKHTDREPELAGAPPTSMLPESEEESHFAAADEVSEAALPTAQPSADILPFRSAAQPPRGLNPQADKREAAERAAKEAQPQEMVKISAELIDQLVNLAGETSITRGRVEQQVIDFALTLNDVDATIARMQDLLRRMEIETEAQVQSKIEEIQSRKDDFDPLEMDRYSTLQQLTRSLMETSSDLLDLRAQLTGKARETEMILLQQSRINTELQEGLMRSRMVPFSRMVPRLRRIVRQVSGELKKEVDFDLLNIEGEMDRTMLERMVAPLEHMLRNALDHGIEMPAVREKAGKSRRGRVVLSLAREGGDVLISLKDDGGGIPVDKVRKKAIERGMIVEGTQLTDHEVLQFILQAGFSTAEKVTQISGRGVGMDVVHSEIKQLGGSLMINSKQGEGTEFVVRLPFTVSVNRALMVKIGDDLYAVPLNSIEGIVRVSPFELENYYHDKEARFEYAGVLYEVRYLGELLQTKQTPNMQGLTLPESVILVRGADHSIALHVDQLLGSREIVVKSLGPQFGGVPGLSGATILGDGSVVVILDLMALVRSALLLESQTMLHVEQKPEAAPVKEVFTVMVVDDSVTVRKVTSRFLEREGFEVILAKDGADAMLQLQDRVPDIMLLDIEMPRMDGFEVASAVKNAERLRQIPIIMITSRTGDKHRERAMGIGVERYMGKPFVEDELLQTINQLLAEKVRKTAVAE